MRFIPVLLVIAIACSCGWADDPPLVRDAKKELQSMQGAWRLIESESKFYNTAVIARYLPNFEKELLSLNIEGNTLKLHLRRDTLVVANDLAIGIASVENQRDNLICFTFDDGRAMLGRYKIIGDNLEIRIPETCACIRSGTIARFARVKQ